MSLTLKVVSYRGLPNAQGLCGVFDQDGGLIGRSLECHLVLPDPEKFISRKHAMIEYRAGVYRLTDTSTGGTALTNRNVVLQHDSFELADGDRIKIGDYEIQVSISGDEPSFAPAFPQIPEPYFAPVEPGPFAETGNFPPVVPEPASGKPASLIDTPDVPIFQAHFAPPEPEPAPAEDLSDFNPEDLLADLESAGPRSPGPAQEQGWEIPDDLFKGFDEVPEPAAAAFSTPPSDSGEREGPQVVVAAPLERVSTPIQVPPVADSLTPSSEGPHAVAPAEPVPAVSVPVLPAVRDVGRESELFCAFLEGAGIADAHTLFQEADLSRLMHTAGALLRSMTDGLMTVLRARAELKSQFRVSMTTIRPANNNPLKFTVNIEEALKILLAQERSGFIEAQAAVREGFDDLMNHQMAMTAATQASVAEILKRFNPQRFEGAYEQGIVFQKKAKCWDAYCKAYSCLVEEAMESFFGDQFADAYEQQLRALRPRDTKRD